MCNTVDRGRRRIEPVASGQYLRESNNEVDLDHRDQKKCPTVHVRDVITPSTIVINCHNDDILYYIYRYISTMTDIMDGYIVLIHEYTIQ
ncbi:hypothetical protein QTP88_017952 [Uroleucon formosanum]